MRIWCVCLTLGALTFAACGGEASAPTTTTADTAAPTTTVADTATPTTTVADTATPTTTVADTATPTTTVAETDDEIKNMWYQSGLQPVEPGTYYMDPDLDFSTPLRVVYDIPFEGWSQWAGTYKVGPDGGHVGVTITTVDNLVTDACLDHNHADPPIGESVEDLANAMSELAPFQVNTPPEQVTAYGYDGIHLEWTVPDLAVESSGDGVRFSECHAGELRSWVAPFDTPPDDAFYGYTGPGYTEEFWILDVDGTRVMIAAERSAGSPQQDLDEQQAILDSIRIEP